MSAWPVPRPLHACLAACCLLTGQVSGQSFNVGPGGAQVYTDNRRVLTPPPPQPGPELRMASLPIRSEPALFYLNAAVGRGRTGPFPIEDGARLGSESNPHALRLAADRRAFTLHPPAPAAPLGPFALTNGSVILIHQTALLLERVPPRLRVTLEHPDRIAQLPTIGVAAWTPDVVQALYTLRAQYASLAARVDRDTADVEFAGVPRVYNTMTGNVFTPVVRTSARDRQNALVTAERTAISHLEKRFSKSFSIRSRAITDGLTFHFDLPKPGDYLLCVMQRVRDPDAAIGQAGSRMAVWWTRFHFDGERPISLLLTAENAVTWREIFALNATP